MKSYSTTSISSATQVQNDKWTTLEQLAWINQNSAHYFKEISISAKTTKDLVDFIIDNTSPETVLRIKLTQLLYRRFCKDVAQATSQPNVALLEYRGVGILSEDLNPALLPTNPIEMLIEVVDELNNVYLNVKFSGSER